MGDLVTLRPYQEEAVGAIRDAWRRGTNAVLVTAATGSGKTHVALETLYREIMNDPKARAVIIAHRKELIEQPIERMREFWPDMARCAGVVMAESDDAAAKVIVATVQTLCSEERLARVLSFGPITHVIIDECHHSTSDTYQRVINGLLAVNPKLKHMGMTATPMRADGEGLAQVYDEEVAHYDIRTMVQGQWLVPPRWLAIQTGISLANVAVSHGDFVGKQLADVYETDNCFELVVETHKKYAAERQALAFVQSVDGAYALADMFRSHGIVAEAADGTTPKVERAKILADFRSGRTQVLCNVALYTEGLDVPQVSCIHQVRPTKSDGLYIQMVGRSLRIVPGKEDALILDYAPQESRNIVMLGDVLGSPIRKELTIKESDEPGEVIGGFTYDGQFKWLTGDVNEIVSRKLDYLELSPWSWFRDGKWLSLSLGTASDGIARTLIIGPADDDGECTLYGSYRRNGERSWHAAALRKELLEDVTSYADTLIAKYAEPILASRKKRWRKQPVTDAQLKFERWYGIELRGLNRGEASQAISHAIATRALSRELGIRHG